MLVMRSPGLDLWCSHRGLQGFGPAMRVEGVWAECIGACDAGIIIIVVILLIIISSRIAITTIIIIISSTTTTIIIIIIIISIDIIKLTLPSCPSIPSSPSSSQVYLWHDARDHRYAHGLRVQGSRSWGRRRHRQNRHSLHDGKKRAWNHVEAFTSRTWFWGHILVELHRAIGTMKGYGGLRAWVVQVKNFGEEKVFGSGCACGWLYRCGCADFKKQLLYSTR